MQSPVSSFVPLTLPKLLITGGTGLVGSALKTVVRTQDYDCTFVSSRQYDLTDLKQTQQMFAYYCPDYVIHLAANVGGLYKNMNHKVDMLEINLAINFNVVKCCHQYKVKKLIACLSTCIFPDAVTYPIDEQALHQGPPHPSNDAYAYAKRMLEVHCRAYRENYGDNFICIIPTNIYGPNDNFDLENGHVLPALIHKCCLAKERGEDFVVRGTGSPLRQFIFSQDLAHLIMNVLRRFDGDNIIMSVPEKEEISIKDVAAIVAECFDYGARLTFDPAYSDGQYKKTVSNEKLSNLFPDFQFTDIREGIRRTVEWFIKDRKQKEGLKNIAK
jgi:GDP-L-fucose synthase